MSGMDYSTAQQRAASEATGIDVIVSRGAAPIRVEGEIAAGGLRVNAVHRIGDVGMDQLGANPVWVELGEDDGPALDRFMTAFNAYTDAVELPAVIAMPAALVDAVTAATGDHLDLLVDPDAVERASALSILAARATDDGMVADSGRADHVELRQLSEEVQRIAAALTKLSGNRLGGDPLVGDKPVIGDTQASRAQQIAEAVPDLSVEDVRAVIRARRLRDEFFDKSLFGDPAWDMMLDLLAAEIAQHRVPVSSLCMAAAVPPTTALRWIKNMTDKGLFLRRPDPHDGRRVFIELAEETSGGMRGYFAKMAGRVAA